MNRKIRKANTNSPVQCSQADNEVDKRPNKISDARAEYAASATAGLEAPLFTKSQTYRRIASKPQFESAESDFSSSQYIAGIGSPQEVRQFAIDHALLPHLERAIQLVYECFPSVKTIELAHEIDWEIANESWIAINIQVPGETDKVLEEYLRYNRRMVQ